MYVVAPSQQWLHSGSHRNWRFNSIDLYTAVSNRFRLQLLTACETVAVIVSYDRELYGENLQRIFW